MSLANNFIAKVILKGLLQLIAGIVLLCLLTAFVPDHTAPGFWERFVSYLKIVFTFRFSESWLLPFSVFELLSYHFKITFVILTVSILFVILFAVPAGVLAAKKQESALMASVSALLHWLSSVPLLVWGVMLMFAWFSWFSIVPTYGNFEDAGFTGKLFFLLPVVLALSFGDGTFSDVYNKVRSETASIMEQPWMKAVKARRSSETKHLVSRLTEPVFHVVSSKLVYLISGTIIVEFIFDWRGLGWLLWSLLTEEGAKDYPVLIAVYLVFLSIIVTVSVLREIASFRLNPQRRYS
ncbi:ABC-type dipeptide/oligopeptide/nickel transport system, permease component [Cyclonatronum proteinivorum]|uniref:ABC-type dipeptide/oligopeptide/nickel transport system, permease component n=1 Tax=Cyclonatronum proteinivorum TaxID=1457365 RepID=A0A345UHJ8_9BACT|nr:ABC transporter permease subunit [Cyclonatronum proteinivorum]AXI99949.1 ABC-type dipeptide/oligopeptide/nickel transport system, permease component [Cyclonatronum proteinivorum]